jgi:hypothetical protein
MTLFVAGETKDNAILQKSNAAVYGRAYRCVPEDIV